MDKFLILACLFLVASASSDKDAKVVHDSRQINPDGSYTFSYSTSNSLYRFEEGVILYTEDNRPYLYISGLYSYVDDKGELKMVQYDSDYKGYRVRNSEFQKSVPYISASVFGSLVGGGLG